MPLAHHLAAFAGPALDAAKPSTMAPRTPLRSVMKRSILITLVGTAGAWFFFNVAVYGNNVSQPLLIKNIEPHASTLANITLNAVLVVCFSVPGAIVGLSMLDRLPRRAQQVMGFALCAAAMAAITFVPALSTTVLPFAVLYGVSLFGVAFGPNYTTMLLGAEAFPTSVRSTFHGLSSGFAKVGAFIGALLVPLLLNGAGLRMVTLLAMGCFLAGGALTYFVREPNGLSLDEASGEAVLPVAEESVRSQ